MNWILENKKTSCKKLTSRAFCKVKNIFKSKKTKALVIVLFLGCVLLLPGAIAHAWSPIADTFIGGPLLAVKTLMGLLVSAAASLFGAIVDPKNISGSNGILNKQAIKDVWIMVRDTLNMFFILVLLFSAFCTIFQVERWNLKKVWLNILINSLLVNFSFPIARIIIDISNVAMYYFMNNMFSANGQMVSGTKIFADFGSVARLGPLLQPGNFISAPLSYELAIIIFLFIIGMTLLIIAILFVVRLVALALLVMFSPIGFVGYIFPATSEYADKWWKMLFSYSFFAPIMMFMMAVALSVSRAIGDENYAAFVANSGSNTTDADQASFIASAAFFCIPIIILWFGMGIAKSMGIAGADTVVGGAQKFGKWAGKKFSGYNYMKKNYDQFKSKRDERQKEIDKKRFGARWGDKLNEKQDSLIAKIGGERFGKNAASRVKNKHNSVLDEDVKKATENYDTETTDKLKAHLENNVADAMSSREKGVEYMAKYKQFTSDPIRKQEHEAKIREKAQVSAKTTKAYKDAKTESERQAALESHVQTQIAKSYGEMKNNYSKVKAVHSKKS